MNLKRYAPLALAGAITAVVVVGAFLLTVEAKNYVDTHNVSVTMTEPHFEECKEGYVRISKVYFRGTGMTPLDVCIPGYVPRQEGSAFVLKYGPKEEK